MAKKRSYTARVKALEAKLGSQRAVARALGVANSVLRRRISHPDSVRLEHELALSQLEENV